MLDYRVGRDARGWDRLVLAQVKTQIANSAEFCCIIPPMTTGFDNLNHNQRHFVAEYVKTIPRNGVVAYQRAYPEASYKAAASQASILLQRPEVIAEVERREAMLSEDLHLEALDVIREVTLLATADPRELSEHHVGACRHCHGDGFKYHRTPQEYRDALAAYMASKTGRLDPLGLQFDPLGGVGFNPRKDPREDCPECHGMGAEYSMFKDTRRLSKAGARLFAGVKRTKDGLQILTRSQDKALELAGQHLGLFKKSVELTGKGGGPLQSVNAKVSVEGMDAASAGKVYQNLISGD